MDVGQVVSSHGELAAPGLPPLNVAWLWEHAAERFRSLVLSEAFVATNYLRC